MTDTTAQPTTADDVIELVIRLAHRASLLTPETLATVAVAITAALEAEPDMSWI